MAQACGCAGLCEKIDFRFTNCNPQIPGDLHKWWSLLKLYQGGLVQVAALEVHTASVTRIGTTGRQPMLAQEVVLPVGAQVDLEFLST